ncbi:S-layer homology domain-containing protein [Psychrobacillus sp. OK028]|uniref:S-layer homology domain-containing protein n=1 Tax=Psychrobacillus sp. OK028 TaxID=1884359 RepID=UPI00088AABB7|nr:S-layer homology domain-containing protein [Psychrobacillus sp. OK028]SDM34913.1 S-layer homology domain-containing protein [Psychrobacillus sp. OK028]
MAYQPKSYKKFVATAATATLVATAIAPTALAASFTDVSSTYKTAVDYLIANDIAKGKTETTFGTTATITRGDAAVMIANALKLDTTKAPDAGFKDVNARVAGAVNALVAAKIVSGKTATTFAPDANITRQEMAKIIANAYELEAGTTKNSFVDVNSNWDAFVDALVANNITLGKTATTFASTAAVTRGEFALFVYRSETLVPATPEVVSVSANTAKSLKVEFKGAVDTTKAQFAVKKGSITANVAKVTFADDKKSATLELSSKLTAGDYTVTVTGLTEQALVKTAKVENEKVAKLDVLSENAVISATDPKIVTTTYKVLNQYGEDITKTATNLTVTSNVTGTTVATPANGLVTITTTGADFKTGDKISLSILDSATSTFTSKVLTVSNKATVSDVTISGLYNADATAALTTDATATDFHLLVNANDQYGNKIPFGSIAGDVIVTTSDASVIDVKGGVATPTFESVTIDGKTQTVLELKAPAGGLKAGKATVSIISKTTGKVAQYVVDVKEGVKADAVSLSAPELAVALEDTVIPFSVFGVDGAAITKTSVLNGPKGVTVSDNDANATVAFVNDTQTGNAKLVLTDTGGTARKVIVTATSSNGKVATLVVDVKAAADAKVVTATKDIVTDLAVGGTFALTADSLVVKDQYGRDFDLASNLSATAAGVANAGKYLVKVAKTDVADDKITVTGSVIASDAATSTITGAKKGSESIVVTLQKVNAAGTAVDVDSSELEVNVKVVAKSDIVSYEVKDVAPIYDEAGAGAEGYTRDLVVYGVLADGKKVVVPASYYTVQTSTGLTYSAGKLDVLRADDVVQGTNNTEASLNVKVIVDATNGPVILDKAVKVTKAAPVAETIDLKTAAGITVDGNVLTGAIADVTASADLKAVLEITDQYGQDISATSTILLTATNFVNADNDATVPTVSSGNGTATLTFGGVEAGDSFNLTYVVDGKVKTVKVIAE